MNSNGFDKNNLDNFKEKPSPTNSCDDVCKTSDTISSEETLEEHANQNDVSDNNLVSQNFEIKTNTQPLSHAEAYIRYKQYSEYYDKMHIHQPIDAQYRQRQYKDTFNASTNNTHKKIHRGIILSIVIIGVILTFSLGSLSAYAFLTSPMAKVIGVGISNVFYRNGHSLLSDEIGEVVLPPNDTSRGGVKNPPSLDIISVAPSQLDKIYDNSGREILNAASIYEKVSPSVVSISTKTSTDGGLGYTTSGGSGIVFSSDGYIITNAHLVDGTITVNVILPNDPGTIFPATIIGSDSKADIAVIKIDANNLISAEFGDSDLLKIGDVAVAIGNPSNFDLQGATTQGIISGLNRELVVDESGRTLTLIQTDAAINPGNSGGPLINCYGQVIGINTIGIKSVSYEGLNFAIPSNIMKPIVEELLEFGYVKGYPSIGIIGAAVTAYQAQMYGVPLGVIVDSVNVKSDAYKKGIQPFDIITHVNGKSVMSIADINKIKNTMEVGDTIKLTFQRDGKVLETDVILMDDIELQ